MLFYQPRQRERTLDSGAALATGLGVGGVGGFLGGLLGVGGGNIIVPMLNWLGLDAKVAVGTSALVVVFSSLSGFLGHVSLGGLDPMFIGLMAAYGCRRLHCRVVFDDDQGFQQPTKTLDRCRALADRGKNDL